MFDFLTELAENNNMVLHGDFFCNELIITIFVPIEKIQSL